ncbi:hypothetical protein OAK08_01860, partial [Candidatus Pelagibacter sp.]|nr:hypothetical protein [Candidatus Pelagibacter sp.]
MKRLLVYLFIILGLGLNSITNSPATPQLKNSIENNLFGERFFCIRSDNNRYIHYSHGIYPGKNNKPRDCRRDGYFIVYENSNKKLFKKLLTIYKNYHGTFQPIKITKRTYTKIINNPDINIFKEETQITKAEPDQTKSAEVYWDAVIKNNSYNKKFVVLKQSTKEKAINLVTNKCVNWLRQRGEMYQGKQYTFCTAHLKISKHKTQIAKAEPSQTQKVAKENKSLVNLAFCHEKLKENFGTTYRKYSNVRLDNCEKNEKQVNWVDFNRNWMIICYNKSDNAVQKFFQPQAADNCNQFNENIIEIKYDGESFYYGKGKALNYVSNPNIQNEDGNV